MIKIYKITCAALIILLVAVISVAAIKKRAFGWNTAQVSPVNEHVADKILTSEIDENLLILFEKVNMKFNPVNEGYALVGSVHSFKKTDTLSESPIDFVLCRNGKDMYYRLGNTETINFNGQYLFIDHDARQIILYQQREITAPMGFNMKNLKAGIQSEGYELVKQDTEDEEKLSLLNQQHITCKEYTITFNKKDLTPTRVYMRLSDPEDSSNDDNGQITDIRINKYVEHTSVASYVPRDIWVKEGQAGIVLSKKLEGYTVITE